MANIVYGDISPRTAAFVVKDLLKRGFPYLVLEKFGQAKPIPTRNSKTIKFRRYYLAMNSGTWSPYAYFQTDAESNFSPTVKTLSEGVTPAATSIEKTDYEATLIQVGDRTVITDVVMDTHEDDILRESIEILGEQAAIILEKIRFNVVKAGTNVVYADAGSGDDDTRAEVETVFSAAVQRSVTRTLKRQLAKHITSTVKSTPAYGTESIQPAFIGICHPDLEYDISQAAQFTPVEKYSQVTPFEGEIGKIGDVRYICTTIFEPWLGAGGSSGTNVLETSSAADIYPILYLARDAYGLCPLKGKDSITPMVVNPKPSDSDPMAQRGHVSWKAMTTAIILNDSWMVRAEVACTDSDNLVD